MRQTAKLHMAFFTFLILVKIYERQMRKNISQQHEKLLFIVAFRWPTSWQSAEHIPELWEDQPAYFLFHCHIGWTTALSHLSSEDIMQATLCLCHNLWDGLVVLRWYARFDCIIRTTRSVGQHLTHWTTGYPPGFENGTHLLLGWQFSNCELTQAGIQSRSLLTTW